MDVEVIDVEVGNMHQQGGITDDGDDEPGESGEANVNGRSNAPDGDNIVEPQMGMVFLSGDQAKKFYDEYARRLGFTTRVSQFNRLKTDFLCDKVGLRRVSGESCDAMLRVELKGQNKWVVTKYVKDHSHSLVYPNKVHYRRSHKHFSVTKKNVPENNQGVGIVPSGVMYVSVDGNRIPAEMNHGAKRTRPEESDQNVKNTTLQSFSLRHCNQRRTLGRDAQNLLDYFKKMQAENPGFYYAIQLDEDNRMSNVFWADARSRNAYSHFGDAVVLDTMYRVNQCRVPFTPLTGVNHHGLTILFGCALLLDESEATFVWLFKTFLAAMNDRVPVSIITDQDTVIQSAVAQVFPETRHCINKWHVLRGGQDRMAHVCHMFPNFQVELYNCINLTETVEEFESYWEIILDKYDLKKNDWLQSIYNTRRQWVPVYFRDTFFAAVSCNQEYECSFFDGYVSQQITLPLFFRQYERALENSFEKETEADFDTICTTPPLRTPSPMEKQAATLYTKKIFLKFQEELVETFVYTANRIDGDGVISTFRVAKFEDDQKAYLVSLNISELKANCSCQMFECSGILCRHILTVFTVTNILTLPSHYILKRWTINAKCGAESDERVQLHGTESMAQRYNSLCKEAIRCAEEGAVSQETYNAALGALKGGVKKAALAKRNVAKVSPPSSQASCVGYDDPRTSTSASEMTPLLWPRQDEMTKRFNLNDTGSPARAVADLNPQRMAPVSLHRDDGHADNMVILPCLKSMTWVMENKTSAPANRVAVINLKLQDYIRTPSRESEVKFQLSQVTLEPMLKSMAYISEQLSAPANRVAVINLKLQDTETTLGESEVKFQVSRDTLGAMLRSMAYIREQLSNTVESQLEIPAKKQRK
ncbi:protein FAR1-RELATED SEQUENCE 3 isoform X1 [Solanum dulcamara]|uniref:protein FAR1-RELATED SEQUENCE 3 isoform X1 n=1 Tax=Solanum dulcamara TaxID=45834 RepID=UPI002486B004|nr:protein FAR1-RELATED SEQUENCE 3 isoform X1 [Solanum dulcamara]XP_055829620.1 protein FAR1-RELATED SEQUENCE 3 isoform X1 [Solanum dulcamara]XP_055829621.1 protein FAR1-RELATED SEQUENCE 3 isoform X1 [Solanum dulcamara]